MKVRKIISLLIVFVVFLNAFALTANAEDGGECRWYVKHSGTKRPCIDNRQQIIKKYNAYYIDEGVSDDSDRRVIYLTFDSGYENGNTEKILDVLKDEGVPAAFFVLDNIILKNTDLVKRMADEGHLVCNHTKNHKNLNKLTNEQILKNLSDLEKVYFEKTGREMSKFFRFPEGTYSERTLKCVSENGYTTMFWSFAYPDWDNTKQPNPEKAKKKILENTHNGAVILLHPTSKTNAEIMSELIREWKSMGYSFGTLCELVGKDK